MDTQVLLLGAIGGLLPDLLRIAKAKGNVGDAGGTTNVLISMLVLAIIGAIAALAADSVDTNRASVLASLTAGFTGPEVISRLVGGVTAPRGGDTRDGRAAGSGASGLTRWWSV